MPETPAVAQVSNCINADFELNNFSGWIGRTGNQPTGGCCPIVCPIPGIVPGRHAIMTAGTDANVNGLLSVVAPGGTYSVRLGNDNVFSEAEQLRYSFLVTPQTQLFIYRYAVVLQDPGHTDTEQPRFEIRVFDQNGSLIDSTCGVYSVAAGAGIQGFQDAIDTTFNNPNPQDTVRWKDWTAVGIDLSGKLGSTVTIEFSTGDCALGQHYGYAYIDCMCNSFYVTNDYCPGSLNATLSAPAGFATYVWSSGATTQSITVNNPVVGDSVFVTMTTENGCSVTLISTMRITSIGAAFTESDSCYNATTFLDSSYIIVGTPVSSWFWDFGDGTTSTSQNPAHSFPALGSYTVTLIAANQAGCKDTVVKQIVTKDIPDPHFSYIPECPRNPTTFTDSSYSNIGSVVSWLWDFGDSSSTTSSQNPFHIFNVPGVYNVSLSVTDNTGCGNTITQAVSTLPSPTAGFSYLSSCTNTTVAFTDTSKVFGGNITSWTWYFGDGSPTGTIKNPIHTYPAPGIYIASLVVVVNGNCKDSVSFPVTTMVLPTAGFTSISNCANAPVLFTDQSVFVAGTITGYSWNFGDGSTLSTNQNPTHVYNQTDTFAVTLTVTSNNGCTGTITKSVFTKPLPSVAFTITNACRNQPVNFNSQSALPGGSITSLSWNFGDFSPWTTGQNTTHIYGNNFNNNYSVTLIATASNGCIDTLRQSITIYRQPSAIFQTPTGCPGAPINFTSNSTVGGNISTITSTQWNFGSATPNDTGITVTHTFPNGGPYNVSLIVTTNFGCTDTTKQQLVIQSAPVANFSAIDQCPNVPYNFSDLSQPGSGAINNWNWNFGDGSPNANGLPATHSYSLADTFSVVLIVANTNGCKDTVTKNIIVHPFPNAAFNVTTACPRSQMQFTSVSTIPSGSLANFSWNFGDGPAYFAGQPINHSYVAAGSFNVNLIVTSSFGCKDTVAKSVSTLTVPQAAFSYTPACPGTPTSFQSNATAGAGAINITQWSFGDGTLPVNGSAPAHSFLNGGGYNTTLFVTNSSGCRDSITQQVNIPNLPVANINATGTCLGQQTFFNDATLPIPVAIVAWSWNFGDGSAVDHNQNTSHVYLVDSLVPISLIVTDANGCIDTINKTVFIQPLPKPNFSIHNNLCAGDAIQISDSSYSATGILQHNWSLGDGTFATGTALAHSYLLPGNYTITLTTTGVNGCVDSISKPVTIKTPPTASFTIPAGCPGIPLTFQNTSAPGSGTSTTAQWNFGDGTALSNGNTVSHAFANGGNYTVTLFVNSNSGCTDSTTQQLIIPNLPVANINATGACLGQQTFFNDATLPIPVAIVAWSWNFGDGSAVEHNQNTSHVYLVDSLVPISLIVTDANGCIDTINKTVFIQPLPKPNFSIHNNLCAGDAVQLNDSSYSATGISQHNWSLGDGAFASGNSVIHTYAQPGNITIALTTIDNNRCVDSISKTIVIKNLPKADFDISNVCKLQPLQFIDQSLLMNGTIVQWNWNFGIGAIDTLKNPIYIYNTYGLQNVSLLVTGSNGCLKDTSIQLYVHPLPDANFKPESICKGNPVTFTEQSAIATGNIVDWFWDFGDGVLASHFQNPVHIYSNDTSYLVSLVVVSDSGCRDTSTNIILVHSLPAINFITDSVCFGQPNSFLNLSTVKNDSIQQWRWNFGDGTFSSIKQPQHIYNTEGEHYVMLTATSNYNCADSAAYWLRVYYLPVADFIADDRDGCQPLKVLFTDLSNSQDGFINEWSWHFGDGGTDTAKNPSYIYNSYGLFDVDLIVTTNLGCSNHTTKPDYINVHPTPIASFNYSPDHPDVIFSTVSFHDQSTWATNWFYTLGDGASSNLSDPVHTYASIGTYQIMQVVSTQFGCSDTSYEEIIIEGVFTLYIPNSFTPDNDGKNDYFGAYGTGIVDFNIRIFSRWGQPVFEGHSLSETWDGAIEGKNAKEDVYYYAVKATDMFNKQHTVTGRVTVVR